MVAGTQAFGPSPVASQDIHSQEAESEVEPGLKSGVNTLTAETKACSSNGSRGHHELHYLVYGHPR